MIKTSHLEVYKLTLTAVTPVSVGSGTEIKKTDYLYNPGEKTVSIIDMAEFMRAVVDKGIIDEYERMILSNFYKGGMNEFLHKFFTSEEISALTVYSCRAEIYDEKRTMMAIRGFTRTADGIPYIAGSSLKGALHNCLLASRVLKNREKAERILEQFYGDVKENSYRERKDRKYASGNIDTAYLNTLRLKRDSISDAVNSEMRSLSVSDSAQINASTAMTLCRKHDVSTDGSIRKINMLRECIKPGTEVTFTVTIDKSIKGITFDELQEAINTFSSFYGDTFDDKFHYPPNSLHPSYNGRLLLGAGTGYFSKTVTYAAQPYDDALLTAKYIMKQKFSKHRHENDDLLGISPRMIKFTEYENKLMPIGLCDVKFE